MGKRDFISKAELVRLAAQLTAPNYPYLEWHLARGARGLVRCSRCGACKPVDATYYHVDRQGQCVVTCEECLKPALKALHEQQKKEKETAKKQRFYEDLFGGK